MTSVNRQRNVFTGKGHNFVAIMDGDCLGGPVALQDYLQMRSSQLVRQMRRLPPNSPVHDRVKLALLAMSEASCVITELRAPAATPAAEATNVTKRKMNG